MSPLPKLAVALCMAVVIGAILTAAVVSGREPSLTREWDEDVRVLSGVEALPDGAVRLTEVRDWRYSRESVVSKAYLAGRYDQADVRGLWLYEQGTGHVLPEILVGFGIVFIDTQVVADWTER